MFLNSLEGYIAAGIAMITTTVIRRLQELGCYELVEALGRGGMGEVWRARHRMLARAGGDQADPARVLGARRRRGGLAVAASSARREATAALRSPHTVELYDFGVTADGTFYYVMELLDGLDLETLVRRHGPLPPERAVHLLLQACHSLAEAHARGLVHRDIKPANIFACRWGLEYDFVKVLDFGLVKSLDDAGERRSLTSEGIVTGTPGVHGAGESPSADGRSTRAPTSTRSGASPTGC